MYIYEEYNFRIISLAMAVMAFIFAVYAEFIGAGISLVLGILLSFSYQGVLIDPEGMRYLKYDRFLRFVGRGPTRFMLTNQPEQP